MNEKWYTVKQISNMLQVKDETVRRWIRTAKLKGTMECKKLGCVITESDLKDFINKHPKYTFVDLDTSSDVEFTKGAVEYLAAELDKTIVILTKEIKRLEKIKEIIIKD